MDLEIKLFQIRLSAKESFRFSWEDANTKDKKLEVALMCLEEGYEKTKIEIYPDVVSSTCK